MTFYQTKNFNSPTTASSSSSLLSSKNTTKNRSDLSFDLFDERKDYSETQFLKNSIANHTKYGSTAVIPSTHFQYVTHYVESSDTLQGLALKYGCKIENIKKCNKLFSDDNNYLRTRFTLLMPIECSKNVTSPLQSSSSSQESTSSLNGNIPLNSPTISGPFGSQTSSQKSKSPMKHSISSNHVLESSKSSEHALTKKQTSLCDSNQNDQHNEESIADFLIRIDSSIAASKREADKIAKKAQEFEEIKDEFSQYRFNTPRLTPDGQFFTASSTSGSIFDDSNHTGSKDRKSKSKKTKYRYEKAHDEIFEL